MKSIAILLLLAAPALTDELRITAACDSQGKLLLHGDGPIGSGETVDIRLIRVTDAARDCRAGVQVLSSSGTFDATLDPGDLPSGQYVIEVRAGRVATAVGVRIATQDALDAAREEEEEKLLGAYRRARRMARELGDRQRIAIEETRASRLRSWERSAGQLASDLRKGDAAEDGGARRALQGMVANLIALSQVSRDATDDEMGDLLRKHIVVAEDGSPRTAEDVFQASRRELCAALAESLASALRDLTAALERETYAVTEPEKGRARWKRRVDSLLGLCRRICERHYGYAKDDGPYPSDMASEIEGARALLFRLAALQGSLFDAEAGTDLPSRLDALRGELMTHLDGLAEKARSYGQSVDRQR